MKSITTLLLIFVICICLNAQDDYLIIGQIDIDSIRGNVNLSTYDPIKQTKNKLVEGRIGDNGSFRLNYEFKYPDLYRLDLPDRQSLYLAIDEGQSTIHVNLDENKQFQVEGSPDTKKLMAYDSFRRKSNEQWISPTYHAMREATKSGDQDAEIAAVEEYVKHSKIHRKELLDFTEKEIGASVALFGTTLRWTGDDEIDRLEMLVNQFEKEHPGLPMTEQMRGKIKRYKKVAIGAIAANIMGKDLEGNAIQMMDHIGKYTLIDFWASWCRPCILQIPDLQKVYTTFHKQGFEIFSYSVDRSQKKWIEAAGKYDMPWLHASDTKGWQSQVAADYNVTFVPFNFLLDQDGKIIAKNLHHKTLNNYLKELFQEVK